MLESETFAKQRYIQYEYYKVRYYQFTGFCPDFSIKFKKMLIATIKLNLHKIQLLISSYQNSVYALTKSSVK